MRTAIVGPCGSGKTTIVRALRQSGIDAYVVSQEHSIISDLWNHQRPDAVVFLDAELDTIRARRDPNWPDWLYKIQQERLANAREHATVVVDTGALTVDAIVDHITGALRPHVNAERESESRPPHDGNSPS